MRPFPGPGGQWQVSTAGGKDPRGGCTRVSGTRQQCDVAPDGRFLINVSVEEGTAAPITVITNWNPDGKQ